MKNVEYWMGYYVNEFTTPNEIIAHFNLEEGIQSGIHDWNNECELECEVRTKQEIERGFSMLQDHYIDYETN